MFIWYFLFWSAVDSEQQQRRTWYSWCNPSVVNVLNMAEIEEERGMRGSFESWELSWAQPGGDNPLTVTHHSPHLPLISVAHLINIKLDQESKVTSPHPFTAIGCSHHTVHAVQWFDKSEEVYAFTASQIPDCLPLFCDVLMAFLTRRSLCLLHWGPLWCDHHNADWGGGIVIWHLWQIQTQRHGIFVETRNTTRLLRFIVSLNIVITSQDKHDD